MIELRDYQKEAISATYQYINNGKGNPVISAACGAGKSILQAKIASDVRSKGKRFLMLVHTKELVEQNANKIKTLLPHEKIGICCSGITSKKSATENIVCASPQTFVNMIGKIEESFDILVIDETHRVPFKKESVYQKIITFLKLLNPNMIIIGMSGTPFREDGTVYDTQGSIFSGLSYNIGIKELLQRNYLCPIISRGGAKKIDLSSVKKLGGEYNQSDLARAADVDTLNESVVNDIIENGFDRNCWLVFCSGIQHGEHLKEKFISRNVVSEVITNNTVKKEREDIIKRFKSGEIKCLINNSILNTGFDHPPIDLVAFVRATLSTSLFIQSVSRGIRKHGSKENCLLLDYGNNIETHGFIDDPTPKIKKKGEKRDPVTRECPKCHLILPVQSRSCECGYIFPVAETVATYQSYSYDGAVTSDQVKPVGKNVKSIMCRRHKKKNSIDSVKITYLFEDLSTADEYLCLDHGGYASIKAKGRVKEMGGVADSVSSALDEWMTWSRPTKAILSFDQKYKRYKVDKLLFN